MTKSKIQRCKAHMLCLLAILIALALVPRIVYFKRDLFEWDSGEYAYAIANGLFPHAPYVGYLALGIVFYKLIPLPLDVTLSLMSVFFGTLSVVPFFYIAKSFLDRESTTFVSVLLFAFIPALIHQSTIQEIAATQSFFVLCAVAFLLSDYKYSWTLSSICYGFAIAIHNSSIMLVPFLAVYMWMEKSDIKRTACWIICFAITLLISYLCIFLRFLSLETTINYITRTSSYVHLSAEFSASWLYESIIRDLVYTLTPLLFFISMLGIVIFAVERRRMFILLSAFTLPFLTFEFIFNQYNPHDLGAYIVFVAPFAAITASKFLEKIALLAERNVKKIIRNRKITDLTKGVVIITFLVPLLFQSLTSPLFSPANDQTIIADYSKWINKVTPTNSVIIVFNDLHGKFVPPWVFRYYTDRAILWSPITEMNKGFMYLGDTTGWNTANDWTVLTLEEVINQFLIGNEVTVFSTLKNHLESYISYHNSSAILDVVEYKTHSSTGFALYQVISTK